MNKIKTIIAVGGTGGHVFPGLNLAEHLKDLDYNVHIITDNRGHIFLSELNNIKITKLPSSPINRKNIISFFLSVIFIFYSILRSTIFLLFNRPKIIFGMGGYASFPLCFAAVILRIKFIIYENNLIVGKSNKYLLPFAEKIFVSHKEINGISKRYNHKITKIGNIIKKSILNFSQIKKKKIFSKKLSILILGGSQAAKIFAETLPSIFQRCSEQGLNLKVFQHCLPYQEEELSNFYEKAKIEYETFNFSKDLTDYFSKVNLAITRSGASMLAELTNANIPFISIPLPTSAENHQLINATFYQKKKLAFLIEEKDLNEDLFELIKRIHTNEKLLNQIIHNQSQYSDKNVYKYINEDLNKLFNEKN